MRTKGFNGFSIEFGETFVTIFGQEDQVQAHWIEDEWIEDPGVVLSIANACFIAGTGRPLPIEVPNG